MKAIVVDLFCGIGGLTHGLKLSGLNVVAGYDIDPSCRYAYEENNNTIFIEADVATLKASDINKHYNKSDIKILVGCAPCQPFSKYTIRYRKNEDNETYNCNEQIKDHNKWRLVTSFVEKILQLQPHIISMENVPELTNTDVFKNFVKSLENIGYNVNYKIAYCPDYGVPQNRRRLVLLASLLGNIKLMEPIYKPDNYLTVRKAISNLPPIKAGETHTNDNLHYSASLNDKNLKRIKMSKQGGTWRDWDESMKLTCHKKSTGKSYPSVYGRMLWDSPSPTITTQFYGYGNGRFGHPEQDRAISIREGAILQSFPTNYKFFSENRKINTRKIGTHIGNAVPVELGKAIGISILKHLKEADHED